MLFNICSCVNVSIISTSKVDTFPCIFRELLHLVRQQMAPEWSPASSFAPPSTQFLENTAENK